MRTVVTVAAILFAIAVVFYFIPDLVAFADQ